MRFLCKFVTLLAVVVLTLAVAPRVFAHQLPAGGASSQLWMSGDPDRPSDGGSLKPIAIREFGQVASSPTVLSPWSLFHLHLHFLIALDRIVSPPLR